MSVQGARVAMSEKQPVYLSYLLRLWSVRIAGDTVWRASLESSLTGERRGFASLEGLYDFLKRKTGVRSDHEGGGQR
jgi:hypothetical protein